MFWRETQQVGGKLDTELTMFTKSLTKLQVRLPHGFLPEPVGPSPATSHPIIVWTHRPGSNRQENLQAFWFNVEHSKS